MAFVVMVRLGRGEEQTTKVVEVADTKVRLRDLQERLCAAFKYPFPKMMASLTVAGTTHDEFFSQPFVEGVPDDPCVVNFTETDDPFFYDWRDRRMAPAREELSPRAAPAFPALAGIPLLG